VSRANVGAAILNTGPHRSAEWRMRSRQLVVYQDNQLGPRPLPVSTRGEQRWKRKENRRLGTKLALNLSFENFRLHGGLAGAGQNAELHIAVHTWCSGTEHAAP